MALPGLRTGFHHAWLPDLSVRTDEPELLDGPVQDQAELAANLRDIRRVNLLLGGITTSLRHLTRLFAAIPADQPITLLDLATGSADIPLAIAHWAECHGRSVRIVASDVDQAILDLARMHTDANPAIELARYDARAVPLPDKSLDIVHCALALHHFAPDDAVAVLREMDRLARIGFVLNDLRRSRLGWAAAQLMTHLTTRNRLTRNDAPLSVRRAYTPAELNDLLQRAEVNGASISRHLWFRMAAVRGPDGRS